jgi:hypothetical protein
MRSPLRHYRRQPMDALAAPADVVAFVALVVDDWYRHFQDLGSRTKRVNHQYSMC